MPPLRTQKKLFWTSHAREKMGYYRLSEQRVRSVMNRPMRVEDGVAPKTVAMMMPASLRAERSQKMNRAMRVNPSLRFEGRENFSSVPLRSKTSFAGQARKGFQKRDGGGAWSQEIWVMVQDIPTGRKVISAWRYPGVSKVRGEIEGIMKSEYSAYISGNHT